MAYEDEGILVDSGQFNGMGSESAKKEIIQFIEAQGLGKAVINFKLRDWVSPVSGTGHTYTGHILRYMRHSSRNRKKTCR